MIVKMMFTTWVFCRLAMAAGWRITAALFAMMIGFLYYVAHIPYLYARITG